MISLPLTFLRNISLSLLVLFSSCTHASHPQLDEAARLMDLSPDSSLNILNKIKKSEFTNNSDWAKYGLLITQAMDKCQINPTDSSLIAFSTDYFAKHGEIICKIKSSYYSGRVYNNIGNKALAITAFFKARQLAEKRGKYFWAGMANRGISDIYCDTYNNAEELHFAEEEYVQFKKSGRQPYLNYALLDLARAHHNSGNIMESSRLCVEILDSAKKSHDTTLSVLALQLNCGNLIQGHNYHEASNVLHQLFNSGHSDPNDSINFCEVLYETGKFREANMMLDSITGGDEIVKTKLRYKLAKQSQAFDKALNLLEQLDSATNLSFETSVSHDLTSTLTEYFELTKQLDDMKIQNADIRLFVVVTMLILILVSVVLILVYFFKKKMRNISDKVVLAESLKETIEEARKRKETDDSVIRMLLSDQYKMLDDLCYIVLTSNDSKTARRKIADTVTKFIDDLSVRSDKIIEMENKADSLYENIFTDFKKDLPNLKEVDYRLFLFNVHGIANPTISLLLKETRMSAVYERKRRIKDKIKQLEENKRDKYLKFL